MNVIGLKINHAFPWSIKLRKLYVKNHQKEAIEMVFQHLSMYLLASKFSKYISMNSLQDPASCNLLVCNLVSCSLSLQVCQYSPPQKSRCVIDVIQEKFPEKIQKTPWKTSAVGCLINKSFRLYLFSKIQNPQGHTQSSRKKSC